MEPEGDREPEEETEEIVEDENESQATEIEEPIPSEEAIAEDTTADTTEA